MSLGHVSSCIEFTGVEQFYTVLIAPGAFYEPAFTLDTISLSVPPHPKYENPSIHQIINTAPSAHSIDFNCSEIPYSLAVDSVVFNHPVTQSVAAEEGLTKVAVDNNEVYLLVEGSTPAPVYISTSGEESDSCLSDSSPCKTFAHSFEQYANAQTFYFSGTDYHLFDSTSFVFNSDVTLTSLTDSMLLQSLVSTP